MQTHDSTLSETALGQSNQASTVSPGIRAALPVMAAVFLSFMIIGMALPVLPLHVHDVFRFGPFVVGVVAGCQFVAALVSRLWAGRLTDTRGPKHAVTLGLLTAVAGGGCYIVSMLLVHAPVMSVAVLLVGRTLLGGAESLIITGGMLWGLALVPRERGAKVIAWVGMSMFAAMAIGAPIGSFLYARRLVVDRLKGRALAIAMVGTPLALSFGVPAGSFLGTLVGWRLAFLAMSGLTIALIGWVWVSIPDFPGQPASRRLTIGDVFTRPGIRPILVTIFAWMAAHNLLYTYIAPFAARAGMGTRVDVLLLAFGLSSLGGIWITGVLIDRMLRLLVLGSLAAFGAAALTLGLLGTVPAFVIAGVIVWGLSFGGASTQLQTAAGDVVGDGADLATAMIATVWNTAIAIGGITGGVLLDHLGASAFPWAMLPMILLALAVALSARSNSFKPGRRA